MPAADEYTSHTLDVAYSRLDWQHWCHLTVLESDPVVRTETKPVSVPASVKPSALFVKLKRVK